MTDTTPPSNGLHLGSNCRPPGFLDVCVPDVCQMYHWWWCVHLIGSRSSITSKERMRNYDNKCTPKQKSTYPNVWSSFLGTTSTMGLKGFFFLKKKKRSQTAPKIREIATPWQRQVHTFGNKEELLASLENAHPLKTHTHTRGKQNTKKQLFFSDYSQKKSENALFAFSKTIFLTRSR